MLIWVNIPKSQNEIVFACFQETKPQPTHHLSKLVTCSLLNPAHSWRNTTCRCCVWGCLPWSSLIFFINSPEEGVNNVFMEFRCQNEENCECQWELENRRLLCSEAQVNVALAKIMPNCWVVPLGNSGQEIRHEVVLCFPIYTQKSSPMLHH